MNRFKCGLIFLIIFSAVPVLATSARKFDEFGDINCEDEMARLNNFAIQHKTSRMRRGYIIFYSGRRCRNRLPRIGEAAARAGRLKPYLVNRRGFSAERIVVIDGGYHESFQIDLWIVPFGAPPPGPTGTVPASEIKFRKGKVSRRQFQCNI